MDERRYLQEVFEDILGIDIELKEDLGNQVKKVVTRTIKKLEGIIKKEEKMHKAGIEIDKFIDLITCICINRKAYITHRSFES